MAPTTAGVVTHSMTSDRDGIDENAADEDGSPTTTAAFMKKLIIANAAIENSCDDANFIPCDGYDRV
jgi:hypothetical protein